MAPRASSRAALTSRNSASTRAGAHGRRSVIHNSLTRPMSLWTCGASPTSTSGAGSPSSIRSVPMMWLRLSCTLQPGHSVGAAHSVSLS